MATTIRSREGGYKGLADDGLGTLPPFFVAELRRSLEVGMTPDQVLSVIGLGMGVWHLMDQFERDGLEARCRKVLEAVEGDLRLRKAAG